MSATSPQSPPKRPRLSLQIRALANGPSMRTSRCLAAAVDVKSPTSFNTLSNVYATAVDRSTPVQENPPTAILGRRPMLRLQTNDVAVKNPSANTPYLGPYLDTPVTAQAISPAVARQVFFPSAMTATPPLSAQPPEQNGAQVFTFDGTTPATALPPGTRTPAPAAQNPKRRTTMPVGGAKLPYTHPRSLRSILRNSPLPPLSTMSPESPRRQSRRLQEKAARRVAYNSPLTQDITTSRYIKSHIDLLAEDATPISPSTSSSDDGDCLLDQAMADAASCGNTRDGGQTPGPFEEMRRRMANMHASTPTALSPTGGGIRKRGGKRREKKRRWVWTIGRDEDGEEGDEGAAVETEPATAAKPTPPSVPVLAVPAPRPRTRNQQAQLAKAVAAATQAQTQTLETKVPLLAVPVPPARAATTPTTVPTTHAAPPPLAPTAPQPQPLAITQQQQRQQQQTRELTPIPASLLPTRHSTPDSTSSCANSVRHLTPEPLGMGGSVVIEPPTPSMESTTSVGSSLRSREDEADVEMSDASSFTSVEDDRDGGGGDEEGGDAGEYGLRCGLGLLTGAEEGVVRGDGDVEMDEGTPTMTVRPVGERGGRGWVPWRDVVS
ncbi:hypothetical protein C8A01DRAFT_14065 [Parachaetomium inaequale]|uniref:Glucan 1, 4-alpha-glucosidase n=1 Tax=Parachaetomium inaequale TaxID=2588326 RepID=A0AAN6PK85_9PEZI|nr:hypothetical protein C8A01DRAFT_14065 [Parachaetomium inaequale]